MTVTHIKPELLHLLTRYSCKSSLLKVLACLGVTNDALPLTEKIAAVDNSEEDHLSLGGGALLGCPCLSD
jgi:hypothetical protein